MTKTVLILGITSDIGRELAARFERDSWSVVGTHRPGTDPKVPKGARWTLLNCDLSRKGSVNAATSRCHDMRLQWDLLVLAAGTVEPIGPYVEADADAWESGFSVNALAPLRFLRAVYDLRNRAGTPGVAMFSGSGTNGAAPSYSAYCASKIVLIKMCELLDAESADTSFFIIGPGIVRTKIHRQTLDAKARSGDNYRKVTDFLKSDKPGTSHDEIYACLKWCLEAGKAAVGGRNISLVHDEWRGGSSLAAALRIEDALYKLRRHGNDRIFPSPSK